MCILQTLRNHYWLPIHARIIFKVCLPMYHIYSGSSPSYMLSLVTPCTALLSRQGLRCASRGDFASYRTNMKFGNRSFSVAGPTEWNSLPESVRQSVSVFQFKTKLKSYLFSLYYDFGMFTRFCARLSFIKARLFKLYSFT